MSDHTADSFDQASEIEQTFREAAIQAARVTEPTPKDFDGKTCYDCSNDIPLGRLNLGKFRCVECQEYKDQLSRRKR